MSVLDVVPGRPVRRRPAPPVGHPAPDGPPSARTTAGELLGGLQALRLLTATPFLARARRGDGQTVIDLPGWKAPEVSGLPLRTYLRALGYRARSWGLGTNRGTPVEDAERLAERLADRPGDPPVALVGWSLGGVVAREIARAVPERVACVVTFGSPVIDGPTHTAAARSLGPEECARYRALVRRLDAERPIRVPMTALYSRRDGVVDWRACIDRSSPRVEHVEVGATHLSLGIDPDVWLTVTDTLADAFARR